MIRGLPASIMLHAAVIGAGYIAWPYVATTVTEDEFVVVPVELVDVGEMTNVAPVIEPQEPEEDELEPEPEPEPEEDEELPVEDIPDERDIPVDEVETAREAAPPEEEDDILPNFEAEADEEEEAPPEEPKEERPATPNPKRDSSALDNLLNSAESTFQSERETRRETQAPRREPPPREETPAPQEQRAGAGERTANTVRIEQLLYNQIYPCWDGVGDQPEPERLNVSMRARLDAEGNVIDLDLLRPSRAPIGDRPMQLAIERAQRAVQKCQPYRLPRDDYDLWKEANINLGPAFTGN
ncbi:hypothetical protein D1224_08320 [Henriciella barbarensis]|uniref:Uncharacterized protein n=1 Tax=Henriciella barbarensis TaxID=86342 RepID=A0A399R3D8_9PROT|nr:hypothetical protein [Henriciella barbarensis]RIJ24232.1 hypothetical protein D1224_08320 [Henriciella barbarensis]